MNEAIVILLRSTGLFLLTIALLRLMGKRQPTRMSPFNFVNYIIIALIATLISTNIIKSLPLGLLALGIWIVLPIAVEYLSIKSKLVHDWVSGQATILVKDGKVMEENLKQVRYTAEELLRDLRVKNVFTLSDVEFAVMETTGDLNVLLKSDKKPVTPHDLERKVAPQPEPQTVILDGNMLNEPLANLGLNRDWLKTQLERTGVSLDNVFIGQVDASGDLYVDLFDDSLKVPQPKVKELVYANIEKSEADLIGFALQTKDSQAKEMYVENAGKVREVKTKLKPYLLR